MVSLTHGSNRFDLIVTDKAGRVIEIDPDTFLADYVQAVDRFYGGQSTLAYGHALTTPTRTKATALDQ